MNIDLTYTERSVIKGVIGTELSNRRAEMGNILDAQRRGEDVDPVYIEVLAELVETLASVDKKVAETFV